jgi:hypothetical protein
MKIISPKKLLIALLVMDGVLGILYIVFNGHPKWGTLFNLAAENNLPTWYSSFQFFLAGLSAFYCLVVVKPTQSTSHWIWGAIGVLMLFLSLDETMEIHEALIDRIMSGPPGENLRAFFGVTHETDSLLWTVVFAPPMIVVGVGMMLFYYSSFKNFPQIFVWSLGGLFFMALAAGLEFVEAKVLTDADESAMNQYFLLTLIEEMAEFLAATLLVWVHYSYAWCLQEDSNL